VALVSAITRRLIIRLFYTENSFHEQWIADNDDTCFL